MDSLLAFGIDLGTSNSAVAVADLRSGSGEIQMVPQVQPSGPQELVKTPLLPSVLYAVRSDEKSSFQLPWESDTQQDFIVGRYARERSGEVPDQVIVSAKSWLCNKGCDRHEAILPWGVSEPVSTISPVQAISTLIEVLKQSTNHWMTSRSHSELSQESVVMTVPASFDDEARRLVLEAAASCGLHSVTLLEEPLAAFYSWAEDNKTSWSNKVSRGELVLVCDIGGGTADFTLICISENAGELELERVSVGEHILLGGDNIDLALAFTIRASLQAQGKKLDRWQFGALVQLARAAKETLLSDESKEAVPISLPSRGSNLFAAPVTYTVTRQEVSKIVLDGFFPLTERTDPLSEPQGMGLGEFGLPYASDPAFTKHLASFLRKSDQIVAESHRFSKFLVDGRLKPSAILFNGGVFHSPFLRERVTQLVSEWNGGVAARELTTEHRDLAVARGAAVFSRNKTLGTGLRIKARTTRSYYIGVQGSQPAVPGFTPPVKGICVAPLGLEEGEHRSLSGRRFLLRPGQAIDFRFFSSAERPGDDVGGVVEDADFELQEMASLKTDIIHSNDGDQTQIPVELATTYSEVGVLEVVMKDTNSSAEWKLEMNTREQSVSS
jgi:molecular chaperone DnaK (HSP70)